MASVLEGSVVHLIHHDGGKREVERATRRLASHKGVTVQPPRWPMSVNRLKTKSNGGLCMFSAAHGHRRATANRMCGKCWSGRNPPKTHWYCQSADAPLLSY